MRQILLVLALLWIAPLAAAQPPPGGGFPSFTPIGELSIVPDQADLIEVVPGAQLALSYTLTNTGSAPLNLTLLGGGRGGFGGGPSFNGSRPPPDGTSPPPGGAPPPSGGGGFPRSVNATLIGDPNVTLAPGESRAVSYDVRVASDAQSGDSPVMLLARERDGNRTATHTTTIRVAVPTSQDDPPAPEDSVRVDGPAETPGAGALATATGIGAAVLIARRRGERG